MADRTLTGWIAEVRNLFPGDNGGTARFFGAALHAEQEGNDEKAEEYLMKAIAREDAGK